MPSLDHQTSPWVLENGFNWCFLLLLVFECGCVLCWPHRKLSNSQNLKQIVGCRSGPESHVFMHLKQNLPFGIMTYVCTKGLEKQICFVILLLASFEWETRFVCTLLLFIFIRVRHKWLISWNCKEFFLHVIRKFRGFCRPNLVGLFRRNIWGWAGAGGNSRTPCVALQMDFVWLICLQDFPFCLSMKFSFCYVLMFVVIGLPIVVGFLHVLFSTTFFCTVQ